MMLTFVGFLFSSALVVHVSADTITACRNGWLAFNGNCYLFGHNYVHFTEAEQYCRQHNSHLVEVKSSLENAFIKDRLREFKPQCYWIGLTDEAIESVWMFHSSNTRTNFTDWYKTEPNGGDCVVFWPVYDYQWGDYICTNACAPMCKTRGLSALDGVFG